MRDERGQHASVPIYRRIDFREGTAIADSHDEHRCVLAFDYRHDITPSRLVEQGDCSIDIIGCLLFLPKFGIL